MKKMDWNSAVDKGEGSPTPLSHINRHAFNAYVKRVSERSADNDFRLPRIPPPDPLRMLTASFEL